MPEPSTPIAARGSAQAAPTGGTSPPAQTPVARAEAPPPSETDEELMARYQAGDEAAFRTLFRRYGGRIYSYLLHGTGSPVLAEDLCQQTWLHLHRARQRFQLGARFAPWLYMIATNLRRDHARARRRHPEDLTADGQLPAGAATQPALSNEVQAVRRAVARLPESYRDVIVMHRWHDLTFAEIAAALGITEGAAKLRAFRGYELLREGGLP